MMIQTKSNSMEQRLADIGRRIDSLRHKGGGVKTLRTGVRQELDIWRRWRDEFRLQIHLGVMEAGDAYAPVFERIEKAFETVLVELHDAPAVAGVDEGELQARIGEELKGLKRELESIGAEYRIA